MREKYMGQHREIEMGDKGSQSLTGTVFALYLCLDKRIALSHPSSFLFANPIWVFFSPGIHTDSIFDSIQSSKQRSEFGTSIDINTMHTIIMDKDKSLLIPWRNSQLPDRKAPIFPDATLK